METIAVIKDIFKNAPIDDIPDLVNRYDQDSRSGVIKLVSSACRRYEAYLNELKRIDTMLEYEKRYYSEGAVCGIDEAGRGPLAGPVVAAAVILRPDDPILYVNDSKKLSPAKREELYDEIMNRALCVGVGMEEPDVIDKVNILQADYLAMKTAVGSLSVRPSVCLNDAVTIPGLDIKQIPIIKGDAKSLSIAAASIIAKVTRDRIMCEYDRIYPGYGFSVHKGYGTARHISAIKELGPCPIHRKTFIKNL